MCFYLIKEVYVHYIDAAYDTKYGRYRTLDSFSER